MRRLIFPLFAAVVAGLIFYWYRDREPVIDTSAPEADREIKVTPIPTIKPGTRVGDGPPEGWTHLILKTRPRVTSGPREQVNSNILEAIEMFSTIVLGRTEADPANPGRYRVGAYAAGLAASVDGQDLIVNGETLKPAGISLNFFAQQAFNERERELAKIVVPAVTSTMVLVDLPAMLVREGKHVKVMMRYAALVNTETGDLDTLLWILDLPPKGGYLFSGDSFIEVPSNLTMDWELNFDANHVDFLGVPKPEAFATPNLPKGNPIPGSAAAIKAASAVKFTPNSAKKLEEALRQLPIRSKKA